MANEDKKFLELIKLRIFLGAVLFIVSCLIFLMIDLVGLNSYYYNNYIKFERECNYYYPSNYKILTNGRRFIVQKKTDNNLEYLNAGSRIYFWDLKSYWIDDTTEFKDSCTAINAIHQYLNQEYLIDYTKSK